MNIIKRNGDKVIFDKNKIINAINRAFLEVDGQLYETETAQEIAEIIEDEALKSPIDITVETIQNWVEDELMKSERRDVARAYVRFRYKKEVARNYQSDFVDAIREKLTAENVQNQNANVDEHSFGGRTGEASSVMTKKYALEYIVSDMARKNHEENMIYIHDLDAYAVGSHNCLTLPIDKLLEKGFNTRQADIRPANSVGTAFQLVAVLFQLQSLQQFGGVSASHLDWTMVPYIRKSFYKHYRDGMIYIGGCDTWNYDNLLDDCDIYNAIEDVPIDDIAFYPNYPDDFTDFRKIYSYAMAMTEKELRQAVEAMYHNLNTL